MPTCDGVSWTRSNVWWRWSGCIHQTGLLWKVGYVNKSEVISSAPARLINNILQSSMCHTCQYVLLTSSLFCSLNEQQHSETTLADKEYFWLFLIVCKFLFGSWELRIYPWNSFINESVFEVKRLSAMIIHVVDNSPNMHTSMKFRIIFVEPTCLVHMIKKQSLWR